MPEKKTKVKLGLKNVAMLPRYFNYIFVHLRKKNTSQVQSFVNFRPELGPSPTKKFLPDFYPSFGLDLDQNYEKSR